MKIKYLFSILLVMAVMAFAASCSKNDDPDELEEAAIQKAITRYKQHFDNIDGIYFYLSEYGDEPFKSEDDSVKIKYTGIALQQNITFAKEEIKEAIISELFWGWRVILTYIPRGSKGVVIFPYRYAFGDQPVGNVKAYSTILYEFKIE